MSGQQIKRLSWRGWHLVWRFIRWDMDKLGPGWGISLSFSHSGRR